jgi:predicted phage-related endonuclease
MLTEQQRAQRLGKITSSLAAGALGIDEHITPIKAWCEVLGETSGDVINEKAVERGNRLENLVKAYPCDVLDGLSWEDAPFRPHPDVDCFGDSCDALYRRDGKLAYVGEAKTVSGVAAKAYGEEGSDEVPNHTLIQAQWHLMHWPNVEVCLVPVLVGGFSFEFRLYKVRRNQELIDTLTEDLQRWHRDYVVTKRPPPAEAGDTDWIRDRLAEMKKDKFLADTQEIRNLVQQKITAAIVIKEAKATESQAKNRLRMLLGDAEGVRGGDYNVYFRRAKGAPKTDWQALARALGATETDIRAHTAIVDGPRRLTVNPTKSWGG